MKRKVSVNGVRVQSSKDYGIVDILRKGCIIDEERWNCIKSRYHMRLQKQSQSLF